VGSGKTYPGENIFMSYKVILLLGLLLYSQEDDLIIWKEDRRPTRCKVIKETCTKIVYLRMGIQREEPIENVLRVKYFYTPSSYRQAEESFKKGRYLDSIQSLKRILQDEKNKRRWFYQYSLWMLAECYRLAGRDKDALASYKKLREQIPQTKFLKELHLRRCEILLRRNQKGPARSALNDFENDIKKYKLSTCDELLISYRARFAEAIGDFKTAYMEYLRLQEAKDKILRTKGVLGELRALRKLQDFARLEKRAKELIESKAHPRILTAAYNGLGDLHLKHNRIKTALMCYLRGVVQYICLNTPEHEYALFRSTCCMISYGRKNLQKKEIYKKRATVLYRRLCRLYPGSKYLEILKAELDKLD
jgi:tetratricopeptide (TPR) repeat protein